MDTANTWLQSGLPALVRGVRLILEKHPRKKNMARSEDGNQGRAYHLVQPSNNRGMNDPGSDIYEMARLGIPVVTDNAPDHMHHKFALFDKTTVLTGSYNWTRSASLQNENIIVLGDATAIASFQKEFDHLWTTLQPLDI